METMKDIAAIIGLVLSVISLITLSTKAGRAGIKSIFKKQTKEIVDTNLKQSKDIAEIKKTLAQIQETLRDVEEVSIQQCRDTIKEIYYKYCRTKQIPLYERKTVDRTYQIYSERFHQNTYAQTMHDEIIKWEIIIQDPKDMFEDKEA